MLNLAVHKMLDYKDINTVVENGNLSDLIMHN